ncbi:MAG TPA: FtsX-like permease family protein [Geothrix sp.]|jgi:putative ABC transport system permease protein
MNLPTIAWNNLQRRKSRMAFLVAGLLLGVATVVTLLSLTQSLTREAEHKLESYGANIVIAPKSDELSLSYGGITLGGLSLDVQEIREQDLARLERIPNHRNIAAVAPKVLGAVAVGNSRLMLMGIDPGPEFRVKGWWALDGRRPASDHELVAGRNAARKLGLDLGSTLPIQGEAFTVTGILRETGSQDDDLLIARLPVAQRLLRKEGEVSLVEVAALCGDCPVEDMVAQISEALPDAKVSAIQQVVKTRLHALDQFKAFSFGVAIVVLLVGAMVVFVTMMGSVNERTREIGILRALGFRRSHVTTLILMEAAGVSLLAGVLGYLSGMGATRLLLPWLAQGHPHLVWSPVLAGGSMLMAVLVGAAASFYPALHASRLDPTEALRAI